MKQKDKIFSGDSSTPLWKEINNIKTIKDAKYALYHVCCKLQELESKIDKLINNCHDF